MEKTIFEKMLDQDTREEFIQYKENALTRDPELLDALKDYLRGEECTKDISRLLAGEYFFGIPKRILLKKRYSAKKRVVYEYPMRDRLLLMFMAYVLHEYDYIFSDNLYSFRKKRSGSIFLKKIKALKNVEAMYVLKTDFSQFGDSIDVEILIQKLKVIFCEDQPFLVFVEQFLRDKRYIRDGVLEDNKCFLKAGSPLTNIFENIYAMEIDEWVSERAVLYGRYGDDIAAFFPTYEEAEACKHDLTTEIQKLGLTFNEKKTSIYYPGEPVEILGMKITGKEIDIADSSIEKIQYRFRKRAERIVVRKRSRKLGNEEAMREFIALIDRKFFGHGAEKHELDWCQWAFPVITRVDSLREIDHILQECLRYVGSGKKNNARYRVDYQEMHRLGYRSLVHSYYHDENPSEKIPE